MNNQTELESKVQEWLEEIKPVPARNPQAAARGARNFWDRQYLQVSSHVTKGGIQYSERNDLP